MRSQKFSVVLMCSHMFSEPMNCYGFAKLLLRIGCGFGSPSPFVAVLLRTHEQPSVHLVLSFWVWKCGARELAPMFLQMSGIHYSEKMHHCGCMACLCKKKAMSTLHVDNRIPRLGFPSNQLHHGFHSSRKRRAWLCANISIIFWRTVQGGPK